MVEHKDDGSIARYNAKLLAEEFTQTYVVGYLEIFALIAKMDNCQGETILCN